MTAISTAIVGSALIGAGASSAAASKQASATKKGLAQSKALSEQSRRDAIQLYNQGRESGRRGLESAFDFYKNASSQKYAPLIASNVGAQRIIGQGAQQASNAIMGLPVDWSFTTPQQVKPNLSVIQNASLPPATQEYLAQSQPVQPSITNEAQSREIFSGRGLQR